MAGAQYLHPVVKVEQRQQGPASNRLLWFSHVLHIRFIGAELFECGCIELDPAHWRVEADIAWLIGAIADH